MKWKTNLYVSRYKLGKVGQENSLSALTGCDCSSLGSHAPAQVDARVVQCVLERKEERGREHALRDL